MAHIKEPIGIDLLVAPNRLTKEDREHISKIIAEYKITGKKFSLSTSKTTKQTKIKNPR